MTGKQKFWLCALGPTVAFGLAIVMRPQWVLYDAFSLLWIVVFCLSLYFWRKAYKASSLAIQLSCLIIPVCGLLIALFGCWLNYLSPPIEESYMGGFPWIMAELGFRQAQLRLAAVEGTLVIFEPDDSKRLKYFLAATKWYRMATKPGCPYPSHEATLLSSDVLAGKSDLPPGNPPKILEDAANEGDPFAEWALASSYDDWTLSLPDPGKLKAGFWYLKAAEQGNAEAIQKVVSMYKEGWGGVDKDLQKAAEWKRKISISCPPNPLGPLAGIILK